MSSTSANSSLEARVVSSALWAAVGDALGWITELSNGRSGVKRRIRSELVAEPVAWARRIGGLSGPRVPLPAGTYSDDTQLRLATSRSIRGDGEFDPETFAKVELTVWPAYALGGGRGTKAASLNLARRNVNWFSNFFDVKGSRYFSGGGNGACMRIQPHVWSSNPKRPKEEVLLDVLRNALITHGHPHGFLGAVFHSLAVSDALFSGIVAAPEHWGRYVDSFLDVRKLVQNDPQLATFWLSAWETETGLTLRDASIEARDEAMRDVDEIGAIVSKLDDRPKQEIYREVLHSLKCDTPEYRGSGLKTALAASVLSWLFQGSQIEDSLIVAANELDSDTDTIGTMAGAILGAKENQPLHWPLQDRIFLENDALRLAAIGRGERRDSFNYPDLAHWHPPMGQTNVIGGFKGGMAVAGLGTVVPVSDEYQGADAVWQWLQLSSGQTILAKRKKNPNKEILPSQLPRSFADYRSIDKHVGVSRKQDRVLQSQLTLDEPMLQFRHRDSIATDSGTPTRAEAKDTIDWWTEQVINSRFDDVVVGKYLNHCIEVTGSIEKTIAFASILAKAKIARNRRRQ